MITMRFKQKICDKIVNEGSMFSGLKGTFASHKRVQQILIACMLRDTVTSGERL
jgi:hypothetical protein